MSQHTPAPWRLPTADDDFYGACVVRGDGYLVADCNVFGGSSAPSDVECFANARLIAAAPDLLAALRGLEYPDEPGRFCDHAAEPCERCQAARTAIAKATGT